MITNERLKEIRKVLDLYDRSIDTDKWTPEFTWYISQNFAEIIRELIKE